MAEDRKSTPERETNTSSEAAPHNPGLSPKPGDAVGESKPAEGAPYDKKGDPSLQPS